MKMLIVEDNEKNRNLLAKQLRAYDHEVTAVANGVEALEQALAQPPDIIISDDGNRQGTKCQACRPTKYRRGVI